MGAECKIIDFHCHVLPHADHGSDGIETTLGQLSLMNDAGVNTAVLTPHFYPHRHRVEKFISEIDTAAEVLISSGACSPQLCVGAEVLYCEGIEKMEGLECLCIRGTNILVLELPMSDNWGRGLLLEVKRLAERFTLVLAHIDRYADHHKDELEMLFSYGALGQINTASLFGVGSKRQVMRFIEKGYIRALGSDLHMVDKRLYARFKKAHKKLGDDYFRIMEYSEELLANADRIKKDEH